MTSRSILPDLMAGVEPPEERCDDTYCPWHGKISTRTRTLVGKVTSTKMTQTITVEVSWLRLVPKYKRYEKRKRKIHAHLPPCIKVERGDMVRIAETRRLAKTVSFVTLGRLKR